MLPVPCPEPVTHPGPAACHLALWWRRSTQDPSSPSLLRLRELLSWKRLTAVRGFLPLLSSRRLGGSPDRSRILRLGSTCWAQRCGLHSRNAPCRSGFSFRAQTCLKLLGFKRSCLNYARPIHITSFPQEDGFFVEEKMTENICKPVANSTPHGMGIKDKQILANMSWKDAYATVLAIRLFPRTAV